MGPTNTNGFHSEIISPKYRFTPASVHLHFYHIEDKCSVCINLFTDRPSIEYMIRWFIYFPFFVIMPANRKIVLFHNVFSSIAFIFYSSKIRLWLNCILYVKNFRLEIFM